MLFNIINFTSSIPHSHEPFLLRRLPYVRAKQSCSRHDVSGEFYYRVDIVDIVDDHEFGILHHCF